MGARGSPRTLRAKSVVTTPGMTSETTTPGCAARRSMRRFAVSELSAAFAALYAERNVAIGTRPSVDETLTRWPRAARDEVGHGGLHAVERGLHVDGDHVVDVVVGEVERRARDAAAGVVDPHVEAAERVDRRVAQSLDVGAARDVGLDDVDGGGAARAGEVRDALQLGGAAGGEDEAVALVGEAAGRAAAPMPPLAPVMTTTRALLMGAGDARDAPNTDRSGVGSAGVRLPHGAAGASPLERRLW